MDVAVFRTNFPEFADTTAYPSGQITFQGSIAEKLNDQCAWGDMYTYAVQLLAAHLLVLSKANQKTAAVGGVPGAANSGAVSSKSVGDTSINFDTANSSEKGAGYYNSTEYGRQYYHYVKLFGVGAIQL